MPATLPPYADAGDRWPIATRQLSVGEPPGHPSLRLVSAVHRKAARIAPPSTADLLDNKRLWTGTSTRHHKSVIREARPLGWIVALRHWKGAAVGL